jgi:hypothetical protein
MAETPLARVAALKTASTPALKTMWRALFDSEPPPYNRSILESRLAYRIQETTIGQLAPDTRARLTALADGRADSSEIVRTRREGPIAGTCLIREWQGVEHCVTVLDDGFDYRGQPYKSLSAIARAITGTRWNGPVFFGLRRSGAGR